MGKNGTATATATRAKVLFKPRTVSLTIRGTAPLSWSQKIEKCPPKKDQAKHEEENWRKRFHAIDGYVGIPGMAVRGAIMQAAKGHSIPGKGKATYSALFKTAIPTAPLFKTDVKIDDMVSEWLNVPSNPSNNAKGQGGRVDKCFPVVSSGWECTLEYMVLDDQITEEVFEEFAVRAGVTVGVGRWRVGNGGLNGMFEVTEITWS